MKHSPPRWADRFLAWYCRHDLLEEIQGDVYELYDRTAKESKSKADITFIWNVLRFFRLKNIRKTRSRNNPLMTTGMIKNILKVAIRNFLRHPAHSFLSVLGLTVSFLSAFLILLWITHESSYDRFHQNPQRIFKVMSHVKANGTLETYDAAALGIDVSSIPEIENHASVISNTRWPNELCFKPDGKNNECIYLNGIYSQGAFFNIFNVPILHGQQDPISNDFTIAISENMATRLFNTTDVIGKTLKIDSWFDVTITAVFQNLPTNSSLKFDFVMPLNVFQKLRGFSNDQLSEAFFSTYIKTGTDADSSSLTKKLNSRLVLTDKLKNDNVSYSAFPFTDWRLKSKFENGKSVGGKIQYITLFAIIAILVVAMAVINFINLSTARATNRSKEIGIRKVTGAVRSSIVFQFVSESFIVVLLAFLLAAVLTQFMLPLFSDMVGEPISAQLFSGAVPLYLIIFLFLVALAAGLYPAFVMSAFQPATVLKGTLTGGTSGAKNLRKLLLVVQLSVSIGIIIFSGVIFNQLNYIVHKDLGYDRENMIRVEPTYKLLKQYEAFKNELLSNPQIKQVTAGNGNPLNLDGHTTGISWPGKPDDMRITFQTLGGNYDLPQAFGLTLTEGRMFDAKKDTLGNEVLVTQEAVKIMGMTNPVGELIKFGQAELVIIGVLKDFHTESLRKEKLPVVVYQQPIVNCSAIYVKYQAGSTQQTIKTISDVWKKMEPTYTIKYWFQDETFDTLYKTEISASHMVILFTIVSLVIAVIGVVGLATYNVVRKKKEIGIKRVFGATIPNILTMLTKEFIIIILLASIIAIPFVWYGADKWLSGFAYRIEMPWWIYVATFLGTALLIALIVAMQGLRAAASNPTQTLRSE